MEIKNGLMIDEHAYVRLTTSEKALADYQINILGDWFILGEERRKIGHYPPNWDHQKMDALMATDPRAASHYTFITIDGEGNPQIREYTEFSQLKRILTSVGRKGAGLITEARRNFWPQFGLIEATLRPQIDALQVGDFTRAMTHRLNSIQSPNVELFINKFDPYEDEEFGIKYSEQGWVIHRNQRLTEKYTEVTRDSLERTAEEVGRPEHIIWARVLVGDAIAFIPLGSGGLWNANTIPSEDEQRREMGSLSNIFPNNLEYNLEQGLEEEILHYAPELGQGRNWEERLREAVMMNLSLHDAVGHVLASTTGDMQPILGEDYQTVKELEAETLSLVAAQVSDRDYISPSMKRAIPLVSLAWSRHQITNYCNEVDPIRRAVIRPYARGGVWQLNYLERHGKIKIDDDSTAITLGDTDSFYWQNREFLSEMRSHIDNLRYYRHGFRVFDRINGQNPRRYINGQNGDYIQRPTAATA